MSVDGVDVNACSDKNARISGRLEMSSQVRLSSKNVSCTDSSRIPKREARAPWRKARLQLDDEQKHGGFCSILKASCVQERHRRKSYSCSNPEVFFVHRVEISTKELGDVGGKTRSEAVMRVQHKEPLRLGSMENRMCSGNSPDVHLVEQPAFPLI